MQSTPESWDFLNSEKTDSLMGYSIMGRTLRTTSRRWVRAILWCESFFRRYCALVLRLFFGMSVLALGLGLCSCFVQSSDMSRVVLCSVFVSAALAMMTCGFYDAKPFCPDTWYLRPCRFVSARRFALSKRTKFCPIVVLHRVSRPTAALHSLLRGGAGGSAATRRKHEEQDLLKGLSDLLRAHSGKKTQHRSWAEVTAPNSDASEPGGSESDLLSALGALVNKYSSQKRQDVSLFDALSDLVARFSINAAPSPQTARKVQFADSDDHTETKSTNDQPDAAPFWTVPRRTRRMSPVDNVDASSQPFLKRPPKIVDGFGKMLCNFHTFNQSLEEGKLPADCIGALVKLENIENLQVLAKVHGLEDKPFALVIWNHQRDLSDAPKDATNRWVLTERHGAVCMPMVKLGNAMPTFPSEPKVLKTSDVTAENLHTVRFSVRKELVPTEWAIARKDPAKYVQQLLPAKGQVRCYSWKELYVDNKLMLTGYAKCSQDCATQLLKQAGDKGIFR